MKAVTFHEVGDFQVDEVAKPVLDDPSGVLLRITLGAICGSDLHLYHGTSPMQEGELLGHEFVGVVEEVGAEVRRFKPGERVVPAFFNVCGHCRPCRRGWFAQCEDRRIFGHGDYFGGLGGGQAEFVVVPRADANLFHIPEGVEDEQAIFVGDILATGYFAADRGEIQPGDTVAVIGAGPVGLMAVMCANLFGPAAVYVVDSVDERLEMAQDLGGIPLSLKAVNPAVEIPRRNHGEGADAVLECVGQMSAIASAIDCARGGGIVSSVGVPSQVSSDFPYWDFWTRDLTFRSGCANVHAYAPRLLELIAAGRLHPEKVISHRMKLEDAREAYRMFEAREATKIVLTP